MDSHQAGPPPDEDEDELPPRLVVGGTQRHPLRAAAIAGGALAAGAGAYLGARALARRNAADGRVNATMAAAITASDVCHGDKRRESGTEKNSGQGLASSGAST